jgi:hypothetical protein
MKSELSNLDLAVVVAGAEKFKGGNTQLNQGGAGGGGGGTGAKSKSKG